MTTSGRPLIYWDACILLAWLRDETRPNPADMEGVARVAAAFDAREIRLLTSVITQIEVLPSDLTAEQEQKLRVVLRRPDDFAHAGVTSPIIRLARSIRDATKIKHETLGTPDAIHLATAIIHGASIFQTFDGAGRKTKAKLIPLSGTPLVQGLVIEVPDYKSLPKPTKAKTPEGQTNILFRADDEDTSED